MEHCSLSRLKAAFRNYFWLWVSSLVLIGATGAVTALYPQFSGHSADTIGLELAVMNGATVVAVLLASRVSLPPLPTLRIAALAMAGCRASHPLLSHCDFLSSGPWRAW